MKTVEVQGLHIQGLSVRTCNADEAQAHTARIGPLWAAFAAQVAPHMAPAASTYGVYHRYASDVNGAFDVLAGTDALTLTTGGTGSTPGGDTPTWAHVTIAPGPYLVFEANGHMPQAVIAAWGRIWRYFADPACPHQRAYTTDFEHHSGEGLATIFIAVVRP